MEPFDGRIRRNNIGPRKHLGALVVGVLVLAVVAIACHGRGHHVGTVHSDVDYELACIERHGDVGGNYTIAEIRNIIRPPLQDSLGWNSRPMIDISISTVECSDAANRALYGIEYHVHTSGDYGGCGVPCADFDGTYGWEVHPLHTDWNKGIVRISVDELDGSSEWRSLSHVLNHESGHIIGLADPLSIPEGLGWDRCQQVINGQEQWIESIMHNAFRCADFVTPGPGRPVPFNMPYPSDMDFYAADAVGDFNPQ